LTYAPDTVWSHVRAVVQSSAQDVVLNGTLRRATGRWGAGQIEVSVEPYDSAGRKAILRVKAQGTGSNAGNEDPELADRVLIAIQQSLLGR